jgi:hypothetical protein
MGVDVDLLGKLNIGSRKAFGVGRVARPHLAADGSTLHIEGHSNDHLAQIGTMVLAVTMLTEALPASSLACGLNTSEREVLLHAT